MPLKWGDIPIHTKIYTIDAGAILALFHEEEGKGKQFNICRFY